MTYEDYLPYSRTELLAKIAEQMRPKRFKHVLGVEKAALSLAERYGCDSNKASLAALLSSSFARLC